MLKFFKFFNRKITAFAFIGENLEYKVNIFKLLVFDKL